MLSLQQVRKALKLLDASTPRATESTEYGFLSSSFRVLSVGGGGGAKQNIALSQHGFGFGLSTGSK